MSNFSEILKSFLSLFTFWKLIHKVPYPRKIKPCLYYFLVIFCRFYSLKFADISLILCSLYLREVNNWERLNLMRLQYIIYYQVARSELFFFNFWNALYFYDLIELSLIINFRDCLSLIILLLFWQKCLSSSSWSCYLKHIARLLVLKK